MLSEAEFQRLLIFLDRPWAGFRKVRKGVKKRLRRHMQVLGCATLDAYLDTVAHDATVRNDCEACLRVTISRFWRDHELWEHLRCRLLPALAARFSDLASWSAGCAHGQEPYSLAMIWEELAPTLPPSSRLRILATDADPLCLQRAREGRYPAGNLKEMPADFKNRWFHQEHGGRQWRIDAGLQSHIRWQPHQLFAQPPETHFHLILLRNNLLTYYQGTALAAAFDRILAALEPGGVLILGARERPPASDRRLTRDCDCPWVYHLL